MFLLGTMMKQVISILQTVSEVMFVLMQGKKQQEITYMYIKDKTIGKKFTIKWYPSLKMICFSPDLNS